MLRSPTLTPEELLTSELTKAIRIVGYDPVEGTSGFHPDNRSSDYVGLSLGAALDYDRAVDTAQELAHELGMDPSAVALKILDDLRDAYRADRDETVALAVGLAHILLHGDHSRDPQLLKDARAALDHAYGSLVVV